MNTKELKRLSRRELVEIIYQLKKNEEELQDKITALEEALEEKRIPIAVAGSVSEAATYITDLFGTAQKTADLYLREIECKKKDAERECARMVEEAKRRAEQALADGKRQYDALNHRYQSDYKKWRELQSELKKLKESQNDD